MRVLVTGGAGFLGKAVVRECGVEGWSVAAPRSREFDLRTRRGCRLALEAFGPDVVIHLAAAVGGIGANVASPGRFLYENAIMGLELMESARRYGVLKYVTVGTTCEYPEDAPVPLREETLWDGHPTKDTAPYGIAKRLLLAQGDAYRREYGFNSIHLLPTNLYGPGDNLDQERGHVIPVLVQRFLQAVQEDRSTVTCWGSGEATREFLYVDDAARGVVQAAKHYDEPMPVNLGTGIETSVWDLAHLIARECGFKGVIEWDRRRPDGQPRRVLDTSRARDKFGFEYEVGLVTGIRRTVLWMMEQL